MSAASSSALQVLDTIQQAAPYLDWRVCLDYSHEGERIVAIGESPRFTLTPEEAKGEAARVLRIADKATHIQPVAGVSLDVHVVASDGQEYGPERLV
jgi:uncharacterized Rossmann fold enzyme